MTRDAQDYSSYDNVDDLELSLGLPPHSLRNIPIYARVLAVDAIRNVQRMEAQSVFRPGLYYIVLADLCGNTEFNARYGDAEGDVRVQWFQTAAIQSLGETQPLNNYAMFCKPIGDAALLIFSAFKDVYEWSERLSENLDAMTNEYPENLENRGVDVDDDLDERVEAFRMRARRLVHLGEVSYSGETDPLCLAVSQTFKLEKKFADTDLGCTQAVADAIGPKLGELALHLHPNTRVKIPGWNKSQMTFYLKKEKL